MGAGALSESGEAVVVVGCGGAHEPHSGGRVRTPYRAVRRLLSIAWQEWNRIDGDLSLRGVDARGYDLRRFLNVVYAWLTHGMDPDRRALMDKELEQLFPNEMTPMERMRAEAWRRQMASGGAKAEQGLMSAFRMPTA